MGTNSCQVQNHRLIITAKMFLRSFSRQIQTRIGRDRRPLLHRLSAGMRLRPTFLFTARLLHLLQFSEKKLPVQDQA